MAELMRSVVSWLAIVFVVVLLVWAVVKFFRPLDGDDNPKSLLMYFGIFLALLVVAISIELFLQHLLPDWSFFHGTDEDGEPYDRRLDMGFIIGFPIVYLLFRGYEAWKKAKGNAT